MKVKNKKYVYFFQEGNAKMIDILGNKGVKLAEMTNLGLSVPQGFTISAECCNKYYENKEKIPEDIITQIEEALSKLEKISGKKLDDEENPLLISVSSESIVPIPGMKDTILNLGINDKTIKALAKKNSIFAYDVYRKFIQMYGNTMKEIPNNLYENAINYIKKNQNGLKQEINLNAQDLKDLVKMFKEIYYAHTGMVFPQNTKSILLECIELIFKSWSNKRAIKYRKLNGISENFGIAINIQVMIPDGIEKINGTGIAFSRNPITGENKIYGEFLMDSQGEDVLSGIRETIGIDKLDKMNHDIYDEIEKSVRKLEKYYKDMQDIEFIIKEGQVYFLQTKEGKRTAQAALRIAVDMVKEGITEPREAILKINPEQLEEILHPNFDKEKLKFANKIAHGLAVSKGAATGKIVFSTKKAVQLHKKGEKNLILVLLETSAKDIEGMKVCKGILTIRGGMTSHAAVVTRGMGITCVAGCSDITINENEGYFELPNGLKYMEGEYISIDGTTGNIYNGQIDIIPMKISKDFSEIMNWATKYKKLEVKVNAETIEDAKLARKLGAEGIGLCRTEHMFFSNNRINLIREMILSENAEQRKIALNKLLPIQRADFEELYKVMDGYEVTIRLLDPPLHEFLPKTSEEIRDLAKEMNIKESRIRETIEKLHEFNPMMGHRGCRLDVTYPEIAQMQTRAIIEAAINVNKKGGKAIPEIMIPLVGEYKEMKYVKSIVTEIADNIIKKSNIKIKYHVGTMIEIPRAALTADEIAEEAEFFSFGTNDLTQMTFGFSRDDASKFLNEYYIENIYTFDPFSTIDKKGVGKLMKIAIELGRKTKPNLKIGVCGEHGGDPASVEFCNSIGLNYVSCSPYRVPIAMLVAAQSAIK